MEQFLLDIVTTINAYLSDYILIILLIGIGIFYTIKTRFVQVRCFKQGIKQVFGNVKLRGGKQKNGLHRLIMLFSRGRIRAWRGRYSVPGTSEADR